MIDTPLGGALVALAIGLLLGLERERSQRPDERLFAGIRTFPLLVLSGYLSGLASRQGLPLVLPALLLAVAGLAVASYLRSAVVHAGATTEAAAILAPLLGALVAWNQAVPAISLAVLVTLLLTLKAPLHRIAGSVSEEEIVAILKFGIVSVVLVPLLPTQPIGPYGALVPRHVGLVVVILCGVSLGGYLLVRLLGSGAGWPLAGAVGGLVSSTAVTLSLSGKARAVPELVRPLALGILLASTVLYLRGLLRIWLFDRALAAHLAPRLLVLFTLGALASALLGQRSAADGAGSIVALGNPVELGRAVGLGLMFAAILLAARAAQEQLGRTGLWTAGFLGGFVDVDSVAIAAARLRQQGITTAGAAGGSYLLATLSNLLVKGGIAVLIGGRGLGRRVWPVFAVLAAATLALLSW